MKNLLLTLSVLAAPMAHAETRVTAQSPALQVAIDGPVWIEGAKTSLQDGIGARGNPVTIKEFIPADQSFDNWSELFAIMIEEDPGLSLHQYTSQQIGRFVGACEITAQDVFYFSEDPAYNLFAVPCGAYSATPDKGEVAFFFLVRADPHLVKIYHHVRGDAFQAHAMMTWPASREVMERFLNNLNGLTIEGR